MQAGLLLKPSYVFFRSVPELHQTQDSTDLPSELLRERGLTSCGACRPTPGHGTGTRLKASAVPLCPAIYTSNLLPTIYIAVYTYRCIYSYTDIRLHTLHLRCLFYIHLYLSFHFRFWFRPHFSFACCHPSTFILQRYRRQRTRQTPECSLLAENFSWPSEIIDCGFLKTFTGQFFALGPLSTSDLTLHIKGSRWRLHRNDKKKFGSKKRKNYKKVENRDAQNKIITS